MFDIGWTEMLVIAIVMIVVVGPKDLPKMLRTFGKFTSKMTSMAGDFRKQFDEALKEAELEDVHKSINDLRSLNPKNEIRKALSPMEQAAADVRSGMDSIMRPKTTVPPAAAAADVASLEPAGSVAQPQVSAADVAEAAPPAPAVVALQEDPLAAPVPVTHVAPSTAAAALAAEPPAKKPRAPRAPKPTTEQTALATSVANPSAAPAGMNGTAVDKPVRSRKPKQTGTAT